MLCSFGSILYILSFPKCLAWCHLAGEGIVRTAQRQLPWPLGGLR